MVLLFVGFTIRYLYEYRKYLLDIYYIQNISMCRNTEKKCMHYENGIKDEKNIWKNLSLTWHNQGLEEGREEGRKQGIREGRLEGQSEGRLGIIKNYLENGGTVEQARELLKATEEEIQKVTKEM